VVTNISEETAGSTFRVEELIWEMVGYIGREGVPHHREPEDMPNDEIPLD
jgi:hypothetical protein